MAYRIINAKEVFAKSATHTVTQADAVGNVWTVVSGTSGETYTVHLQRQYHHGAVTFVGGRCSCTWGIYRPSKQGFRSGCSHVQAVLAEMTATEQGRMTSAWSDIDSARRQHRPILALDDGVYHTTRNGNGHADTLKAGRDLLRGDVDYSELI